MRQLRVHGPSDLRLDEVAEPDLGPDDVVVRVVACGICGTDLSFIDHGGMTEGPMPLGHEMSGVVHAVGTGVSDVAVNDRVVVHPGHEEDGRIGNGADVGGFSDLLLIRNAAKGGRVLRIPDHLDLMTAALAEPVAVGMHAANVSTASPTDKVVVMGCGPIGLAVIATLADRGNEQIIAVDLSEQRLALAREFGASAALDPRDGDLWEATREIHGAVPHMFGPTAGTDHFIEASGANGVIVDVISNAKEHASLTVVAVHYDDVPVSFLHVLTKQLTIRGAMEYPDRFEDAIDLLSRRDLSSMVTHRFSIDQYGEALDLLGESRECGKVLITVGEA